MYRSANILLICALVATPAFGARPKPIRHVTPTPASRPAEARPVNSPGSWITFADYPAEARRQAQEGRVSFRLAVGPNGAVTDCAVTTSSGVPALDATTCALIRRRAAFAPGRAASTFSSSVNWLLYDGAAASDKTKGRAAWDKGDPSRAMKLWKTEADKGSAAAQADLAYVYSIGMGGIAADPKQAEYWYQRAAAQGDREAQTAYGSMLLKRGASADAQIWLEKAASSGNPDAQVLLATELYTGARFPRDVTRAYALMKTASASGDKVAAAWLRDNQRIASESPQTLPMAPRSGAGAAAKSQPGGKTPRRR